MRTTFFVYRSKVMAEVLEKADCYALSGWPVLILGESGVGKELLARRIHEKSPRGRAAFLPINCAAMPAALFESELYGHERGAFSGAVQSTRGLLRQAHGGTLFLDEIGELELTLQAKMLRLLDSGELRSVGGTRTEHVDVRFVAATNVDLYAVAGKSFRLDLLSRIAVLHVRIPPLRERKEDIVPLAEHLLAALNVEYEPTALELLCQFEWPGNVRQMKGVLVRAALLGRGKISEPVLSKIIQDERFHFLRAQVMSQGGRLTLADIEKQAIVEQLVKCHGNRKKAARELGIAKSTLHEKLRRWRVEEQLPGQVDCTDYSDVPTRLVRPSGSRAQSLDL